MVAGALAADAGLACDDAATCGWPNEVSAGLPIGVQIMGPLWEDATPIAFAEMLAKEIGGFTPPPGFRP